MTDSLYTNADNRSNILSWADRLRIAIDAARGQQKICNVGLEYLHYGCKPPIIHRDVKSTNILLNENFQAKPADFGLSRNFPAEDGTRVWTRVAGTPGYLDLERMKKVHITKWVSFMVGKGDIKSIVDSRLKENFDSNSV
ncbi:leucine-rich repeat receptor-like serine/threonine-protein kinase [Pyrus ussuriensis x Pyrus communis]|uniref:Leucine-rich repeat receptor-like serine/threonine-protein kinase n=1 Tax=Pyrus ussuriensis x Pyrus communis TaxID=2448454 RepID=A0A5N5GBT2_9ROSA|nr:leucine-rich repeat receptor-like serine/threonine-protein kinase [Pyrus ussuriensis x Pyrus communis]